MATSFLADFASFIPKEVVHSLSSTYWFWTSLPFTWVFVGHSLWCAMAVSQFRNRYLVHYILTFLWGNGGGLTTALLLMAPHHASLSIFASNEILGIWTVCWWLVNYFPGGLPYTLLDKWYIKVFVKSCTHLLRALLIVGRVDLAVKLYPGVVAAPLVLGTLAGCGGRLIADALLHGYAEMPGMAELTSPGFVSRSAFMAASTYYLLGYVLHLLPASAAAGLVVTILMVHSFATEITGKPLDFTQPVAEAVHALTRIDLPPPQELLQAVKRHTPGRSSAAASPAAKRKDNPATSPAKSPAKSPKKAKTPAKPSRTKPLADTDAGAGSSAAAAGQGAVTDVPASPALEVVGTPIRVASPAKAEVIKASGVKLPAEGTIAATRPRRTTRRSTAVA